MTRETDNLDDNRLAVVIKRGLLNAEVIPRINAQHFQLLSEVHDAMMLATKAPVPSTLVPMLLVMQAQQYFLGATQLAVTGMLTPVWPLLRASLESVAYAILAESDVARSLEWAQRDYSEEAKKIARKQFTFDNCLKRLKELDPGLAGQFSFLYETAIKHGAHPNQAGVLSGFKNLSGGEEVAMRIFHPAGSEEVLAALDGVIRFGTAVGAGFRYALPHHQPAVDGYDGFLAIHGKMNIILGEAV